MWRVLSRLDCNMKRALTLPQPMISLMPTFHGQHFRSRAPCRGVSSQAMRMMMELLLFESFPKGQAV